MLYVAILLAAWIAANRVWRMAQEPAARADALAIQGALAIFAVFTVYSNSPVNLQAFQIVIAAVLGYLAFLYRTHCVVPDSKPKRKSHYYR
jgi:cytochrome c oxidase assembly factor CtaG